MDQARSPRPNTFAGLSLVLDRKAERRDQAAWIVTQAHADNARYLLLDATGEAFLHQGSDALRWLDAGECDRWLPGAPTCLLGIAYGAPHFLLVADGPARIGELELALGARRMALRSAGMLLAADEASLFAYAKGLSHWQRETRFCAYCSAPLRLVSAGHRAQCTNPACARLHFPRTDAAVIMKVGRNLGKVRRAVEAAGLLPRAVYVERGTMENERVLPLPAEGASLVWAVRMQRLFAGSLRLLARQMQDDPRLAGVIAIGGVTALLAPADHPGGVRLMEHLGFTVEPYRSLLGRFGEFWENFYTWWIMWTFNAASLRGRRLVRLQRAEIWMSREKLLDKYGK